MIVYKFGGASVKDPGGVRNLAKIVSAEKEKLVIVVSAFGKTTNALEKVLNAWISGDSGYRKLLNDIYIYHLGFIDELLRSEISVRSKVETFFTELEEYLSDPPRFDYEYEYDQIVSYGEIWSTVIVAAYLRITGFGPEWIDIRKNLITDDRFRNADILLNESSSRIRNVFNFSNTNIYVTQGFIGSTIAGQTTTLGREGSDYTAALLANILDAEKVVVWKDVPGLLNADPKWLKDAKRLEEVSYREAVEMTFSGAKVIHPKTIKPLHNKNIPLHVRSFMFPDEKGTIVKSDNILKHGLPVFVRKESQIMISLIPRDFSFAMGENLSRIFYMFIRYGISVNIVEASAVSIDVCIDDDRIKVEPLIRDLSTEFAVVYNDNVEVLSVRHYTPEAVERITKEREILLEQRTRSTVRFVVRSFVKDTEPAGSDAV